MADHTVRRGAAGDAAGFGGRPSGVLLGKGAWFVFAAGGAMVALATFLDVWWLQLPAFCAIAPSLALARRIPPRRCYPAGLCFFAAWLLPTTYWYYTFMPVWLAVLASVGYVALAANLFRLFELRRLAFPFVLALLVVCWPALTFVRMHLPVTQDWWIPHLGYAVWRNSGVLQLAGLGPGPLGGETTLEAAVVLANALIAWLLVGVGRAALVGGTLPASGRPSAGRAGLAGRALPTPRARLARTLAGPALAVVLMGVVAGANVIVWRMPGAGPASGPARILALQQPTAGGVDVPATREDVGALQRATSAALEESGARSAAAGPTVVVWPENSLSWDLRPRVAEAARELDVAIVFHAVEVRGADHLKRVIMVDAEGRQVLVNAKLHIAPDEIGTGEYSAGSVRLAGRAVTAYVCYDMHYPDSVARIGEADLVLVPINDAAYGPLQQRLHAADLAIRAVQSGAEVVSSSTTGPTVHIDRHGVVRDWVSGHGAGSLQVGEPAAG
ncbi:hypothetical protein NQ038_11705 [Brevibacterium sp. 50QC2O2]|uniref:hypothetical protein n=1 Tax=unclassified Brevibacterium TaxID=2614124 RepID=UPI00211BA227|nr:MULTISPECIES: hypothetical protein [unclassified Brevibacterium]MCQ9369485.1 hypothetical protein [Brevibacterium sp. 91QC2O2]MCQ9389304.1 hypothetical protein [Brevibacterium sp. 50QC2O2]